MLNLMWYSKKNFSMIIKQNKTKMNINLIIRTIISGFMGMALGMSLLVIAVQKGDAGIVAT